MISDTEIYLHGEGTLQEAYRTLGAHLAEADGVRGVRFAVWAPNAENVTVAGEFNDWDIRRHPMRRRNGGVWELFVPGLGEGTTYKYFVRSRLAGHQQLKADPYAFACEAPPKSASVVWDHRPLPVERCRVDGAARASVDWLKSPVSIYEVHLESWMRDPRGEPLTYRELAVKLVEYVKRMGYTHIELLPIMEHPFSGSWGYQVIGYFAPTSRFGTPDDFMYFVDRLPPGGHRGDCGLGARRTFPRTRTAWRSSTAPRFTSTPIRARASTSTGARWSSTTAATKCATFLISNALFWLKEYHIDGLRVDAVASMLYLDYSRKAGRVDSQPVRRQREPGSHRFSAALQRAGAQACPGAFTVAEESTAFPGVSKPVYLSGLGFTMKWNMGWMHDMLDYFSEDPVYRKYHHNNITFSMLYAFTENFVLPISHDEVVHGKRSLLSKMPGDEWQQFANVRAFLAYMWAHPGKKLLFMGQDIGQREEWNHDVGVPLGCAANSTFTPSCRPWCGS